MLVYRANRVVNFAQASIGTFPSALAIGLLLFGAPALGVSIGMGAGRGAGDRRQRRGAARAGGWRRAAIVGAVVLVGTVVGLWVNAELGYWGALAHRPGHRGRHRARHRRHRGRPASAGRPAWCSPSPPSASPSSSPSAPCSSPGSGAASSSPTATPQRASASRGDCTFTIGTTVFGGDEVVAVVVAVACLVAVTAAPAPAPTSASRCGPRPSGRTGRRCSACPCRGSRPACGWSPRVLAFLGTFLQAAILGLGAHRRRRACGSWSPRSAAHGARRVRVAAGRAHRGGGHRRAVPGHRSGGRSDRSPPPTPCSPSWCSSGCSPAGRRAAGPIARTSRAGGRAWSRARVPRRAAPASGSSARPLGRRRRSCSSRPRACRSCSARARRSGPPPSARSRILALSVVVLTGWAGEVTLGQMAFAATGAAVAAPRHGRVARGTSRWPCSSAAWPAAVVAVVVGLPSLRLAGHLPRRHHAGVRAGRRRLPAQPDRVATWIPTDGASPAARCSGSGPRRADGAMYEVVLGVLVLALVAVAGIRRSRTGRVLRAVRDNAPGAQAYGVRRRSRRGSAPSPSPGSSPGSAGVLLMYVSEGYDVGTYARRPEPQRVHRRGRRRRRQLARRAPRRGRLDGSRTFLSGDVGAAALGRRRARRAAGAPRRPGRAGLPGARRVPAPGRRPPGHRRARASPPTGGPPTSPSRPSRPLADAEHARVAGPRRRRRCRPSPAGCRSAASTSPTTRCRCCSASTSTSPRARSPRCSAPTAPASPRCCGPSAASPRSPAARCGSAASTSPRSAPHEVPAPRHRPDARRPGRVPVAHRRREPAGRGLAHPPRPRRGARRASPRCEPGSRSSRARRTTPAGDLSGGQQQQLALAHGPAGPARAAAGRRAVARPRAGDRRAAARRAARAARPGHHHRGGRAVGERRPHGRRPRLLHGEGRGPLLRRRRRPARPARPRPLRLPPGRPRRPRRRRRAATADRLADPSFVSVEPDRAPTTRRCGPARAGARGRRAGGRRSAASPRSTTSTLRGGARRDRRADRAQRRRQDHRVRPHLRLHPRRPAGGSPLHGRDLTGTAAVGRARPASAARSRTPACSPGLTVAETIAVALERWIQAATRSSAALPPPGRRSSPRRRSPSGSTS